MAVRIKIGGLTRAADAVAAEAAGAFYGGVILAPGSPRTLDPAVVPAIFAPTHLARCGVFVNESLGRITEIAQRLALDVIQLHGDETTDLVAAVREATGAEVWKAIRPRTGDDFAGETDRYRAVADGLLLDGWSAAARGGTGVTFPWREVARHRGRVDPSLRLVVAGGLTPENVAEVIALLSPDVVDVSSGVERSPGVKNADSIRRFAAAVQATAQVEI
jgi:phosphoribosylanthranilate isomerase